MRVVNLLASPFTFRVQIELELGFFP